MAGNENLKFRAEMLPQEPTVAPIVDSLVSKNVGGINTVPNRLDGQTGIVSQMGPHARGERPMVTPDLSLGTTPGELFLPAEAPLSTRPAAPRAGAELYREKQL